MLLLATALKSEEQCELEGCTRPRYKEGSRIHNYCCGEHARKDAPNREGTINTPLLSEPP